MSSFQIVALPRTNHQHHTRRPILLRAALSSAGLVAAAFGGTQGASAQGVPNLVSVCSGVSLPPSVVTNIMAPVVGGIVTPIQNTVNPLLGVLVPPLDIDLATLLANAAAGQPITLQVLNANGTVVGPADRCDVQGDSFQLDTEGGIAIGGNRITGLGRNGQDAVAGEFGSIAFGNLANTAAAAVNAVAIGSGASVTAANSVALGAGSVAARGGLNGYTALGLVGAQNSAGEFSVGAAGGLRQITNVAAGTAASDAATVGQVAGVAAAVGALGDAVVRYDGADRTLVTLAGVGGTRITNVAPGTLAPTSTDAVNGAQLNTTNLNVTANTTAIANLGTTVTNLGNTVTNLGNTVTNLGTTVNNLGANVTNLTTTVTNLGDSITNGAIGPVRYSNPGTPTTPNGGVRTNDLTLVGAGAGPVGLHNVAAGTIAAGSTDAVNGGQVFALAQGVANAVTYNTDANGVRTNTVTLAGGSAGAVTIDNVAAATLSATSTAAVNGAQLFATNQNVTTAQNTANTAQTTANTALTVSRNSVQYDAGRTDVTFNPGGTSVVLHNVAAGVSGTDAVNVAQLNAGINNAVTLSNNYTDSRIMALNYDVRSARRDAYAGTSGALAAAGLPQAYEAGKGMVAIAGGTYSGQTAVAFGFSKAFSDGATVVKLNASYDSRGSAGAAGGIGYQF